MNNDGTIERKSEKSLNSSSSSYRHLHPQTGTHLAKIAIFRSEHPCYYILFTTYFLLLHQLAGDFFPPARVPVFRDGGQVCFASFDRSKKMKALRRKAEIVTIQPVSQIINQHGPYEKP
jgi:hypothetical protein